MCDFRRLFSNEIASFHCEMQLIKMCDQFVPIAVIYEERLYGNWSKRRQTETSTIKTSTNQKVDKLKRRQTETSTDQNVDKPKRRQTVTSTDRSRQTKTSTNQNVDKPKRRQTKTSTVRNVNTPLYYIVFHGVVAYLFS